MSLAAMSPGSSTSHSEEDGLDAPDDPKKKKFSKLKKNVKQWFKFGGKKGKTKEDSVGSIKATSSPNVGEDEEEGDIKEEEVTEDVGLSSTYSKSHESVFNNTDKSPYGAELSKVVGKRGVQFDDDDSGAESHHFLSVDTNPRYSSEHSLISMGDSIGSENELDDVFGITRRTTKSPCSDTDLDFIKSTSSLNNEAIKHKISVAPKNKRRPASTYKQARGASPRPAPSPLTLVTEESSKDDNTLEEKTRSHTSDEDAKSPPVIDASPPTLMVPTTKPLHIPRPKLKSATSTEELEQIQKNTKPEPQKRPAHLVVSNGGRSPRASPNSRTESPKPVESPKRVDSPLVVGSTKRVDSPLLKPESPPTESTQTKKLESPQPVSVVKKSPLPEKSKTVRVGSPVKSPESPSQPEFANFQLKSRSKEVVTVTKSQEPKESVKEDVVKDTSKVVFRHTSVERDAKKRQTVHVDSNLTSPNKAEGAVSKRNSLTEARNWEGFSPKSPESNPTSPDSGQSELSSMFNRIKRKSSLKQPSPEKKVVNIDAGEKKPLKSVLKSSASLEDKKFEQKDEKPVPKPVSEKAESSSASSHTHVKISASKSLEDKSSLSKSLESSHHLNQASTKGVTVEGKRHMSEGGSSNRTVVIENKPEKPIVIEKTPTASILKPSSITSNKPTPTPVNKTQSLITKDQQKTDAHTNRGAVIIEKKPTEKKTTFSNNVKNKDAVDENASPSSRFKSRPRSSTLPDPSVTARALEKLDSKSQGDGLNKDKPSPVKPDSSPKRAQSVVIRSNKLGDAAKVDGSDKSGGPQDWRDLAKRKTQNWKKDNDSDETKEKKDNANSAMKKESNEKTEETKAPSPEPESSSSQASSVRNMVAMWGK